MRAGRLPGRRHRPALLRRSPRAWPCPRLARTPASAWSGFSWEAPTASGFILTQADGVHIEDDRVHDGRDGMNFDGGRAEPSVAPAVGFAIRDHNLAVDGPLPGAHDFAGAPAAGRRSAPSRSAAPRRSAADASP